MFKKILVSILICISFVGCSEARTVNSNNVSTNTKLVEIYLPNDDLSQWDICEKNIDISDLKNVIEVLKDSNKCCIPEETEVISVHIKNKIAYVNLSCEFDDSQTSSSAATRVKIYSIVNTLCLNKCFKVEGVKFLIDGKEVETIGPMDASLIKLPKLEL